MSIAASTRQTYTSGERQYLNFCELFRPPTPTFPATENTLIQFATFLAKTVKASSIKNYLAAVRHLHIRHGFEFDLKKFHRLQLLLKGIKRVQGAGQKVRLPITVPHLKLFYYQLAIPTTTSKDSIMLWAAMTLAFFGFLRLSELTCNSRFSSEVHLTHTDLSFFPNMNDAIYLSILIKASKTDPFRSGQRITVGRTNQAVCPVVAMRNYLSIKSPPPGPLFTFESGKPLTKADLTAQTRSLLSLAGLDSSEYAGHSYRIGAATSAASVNIPPWLIKVMGRWSSDCFERYVKVPHSVISGVSEKLVNDI